ncbi:MAG TPA: ParB N-terminal domain-containing protein [Candidatus Paceibacterota bacterium]
MSPENTKENIILISPHELIAHEKVKISHALYLLLKMVFSSRFKVPLVVDSETKTILDGHHRCYVANRLGLKNIPCYLVNYMKDKSIKVHARRSDIPVDKKKVIEMALSAKVFPYKTTKHEYETPKFNSLPLSELWRENNS